MPLWRLMEPALLKQTARSQSHALKWILISLLSYQISAHTCALCEEPRRMDTLTSDDYTVGYVTDVEGNLEYFNRYVSRSRVLRYTTDAQGHPRLDLYTNSAFVFGGDLFDKGPGDIRLAKLLLDLKKRYPSRCFLIIGNRDANKLRFSSELSGAELQRPLSEVPAVGAVNSLVKPIEHLKRRRASGGESARCSRLKWMLEETLGCANTFEFRRTELAVLEGKAVGEVADEEVVQSFMDSVKDETGFVVEYLRHAQVAVVLHGTLFVHGGTGQHSFAFVPDAKLRYFDRMTGDVVVNNVDQVPGKVLTPLKSIQDWVGELNVFKDEALDDFLQDPLWRSDGTRGGEALMAYQSTPATQSRGVMVYSFMHGGRVDVAPKLEEFFRENKIHRVVVGHKPVGDSALLIRQEHVEIVMADTSFSDTSQGDNRGKAVMEVLVLPDGNSLYHGVLKDGREYEFTVDHLEERFIGRQTVDGWWVKGLVNSEYLLTKIVGHKVEYKSLSANEIKLAQKL